MKIINSMNRFLKYHNSDILAIGGIIGLVSATILSSKAAVKVYKLEEKNEDDVKLKDKIKIYAPTILVGSTSAICILGSNILNKKRQACLIGLYCALNERFTKYREKNKELNGVEADQKALESYTRDEMLIECNKKVLKAKKSHSNNLENLFREETCLFYDAISDRYFEATPLTVYSAEYNLCRMFNAFGYVDVNTFYSYLGVPETKAGAEVGWSMELESLFWISFTHTRTIMDDGLACIIITPDVYPYPDYDKNASQNLQSL